MDTDRILSLAHERGLSFDLAESEEPLDDSWDVDEIAKYPVCSNLDMIIRNREGRVVHVEGLGLVEHDDPVVEEVAIDALARTLEEMGILRELPEVEPARRTAWERIRDG